MWMVLMFLLSAAALASPWRITRGAPFSSGRISISYIAAPAPLEATPRDLKTASFPAHRAANDECGDGCDLQYAISASEKFLSTNVGLWEGTAEMSSWSTPTPAIEPPSERSFETDCTRSRAGFCSVTSFV